MSLRPVLLAALLVVAGLAAGPPAAAQENAQSCSFPVTRTDATDTAVTVESTPERVVALGPSAAQTMWDIGGRDHVVGMPVNPYTSYLAGYDERTNVMNPDGYTVNVERVVNLTPDLVLAPNIVRDDTVEKLRASGLTVYKFRFAADIGDVVEKTALTGRLTGNCAGAAERVDWMEERLATVREAIADEPRPRVIYPLGGGVVAGKGTFLHEVIRTAGGSNVAAAANITGYGRASPEVIVARNPQWLILNEGLPRSAIQMGAYNHTLAGREEQFVRVNPNYANQPAPRVVLAVETIAKTLHPEAYAAANATASPTPTPAPTEPPTPTATATAPPTPSPTPTEAPGQPGFGIVGGLVAIGSLVFLRRATR